MTFHHLKANTNFNKCVSNNFPFLFWVCRHIQGFADAFPWSPILLRDGKSCGSIVKGVSSIHH